MDAQPIILTWLKVRGRIGIGYMQVLPFKETYEKLPSMKFGTDGDPGMDPW